MRVIISHNIWRFKDGRKSFAFKDMHIEIKFIPAHTLGVVSVKVLCYTTAKTTDLSVIISMSQLANIRECVAQ